MVEKEAQVEALVQNLVTRLRRRCVVQAQNLIVTFDQAQAKQNGMALPIYSWHMQTVVFPDSLRQVKGSFNVAVEIVTLLRNVVSIAKWNTAKDLMDLLRRVGKRVQAAQPSGMIVKRGINTCTMSVLRDPYTTLLFSHSPSPSLLSNCMRSELWDQDTNFHHALSFPPFLIRSFLYMHKKLLSLVRHGVAIET